MLVLVTGASGYLGSHLVERLLNINIDVVALVREKSNLWRLAKSISKGVRIVRISDGWQKELSTLDFNCVIHSATCYGRGQDFLDIIGCNIYFSAHVLKFACDHGVKRFINIDTMLDERTSGYALSKKQFRQWLYTKTNKIKSDNVRIEHFFGPGDNHTKFSSYLVASLLSNVAKIDLTEGMQLRDFIYIDDVISAIICIFKNPTDQDFNEYQVGTGNSIKLRTFVETAKALTKNKTTYLAFGSKSYRTNEEMSINVNNSKVKKLGWKPRYDYESGLKKMIAIEQIT